MLLKKQILRNWLFQNNVFSLIKNYGQIMLVVLLSCHLAKAQQIANYVNNGGFEIPKSTNMQKAKYWDSIDSTQNGGQLLSYTIAPFLVPNSSFTHQWPFKGNNHFISPVLYKPNTSQTARGYPRNFLKQTLQNGKTYCVKFYANVTNQSSYAVDGLGALFGDVNIDTITKCNYPISYLNPQIQYTAGFFTDTMNWLPITGTFVANGTEKYVLLGNFKSDAATNTLMINPTNSVLVFCDMLYDNVSCIDIDLPAFAGLGPNTWCIPGDSVFIGRQPDVGIDEACMWYKLPDMTNAIDTVAGLWVKPIITTTYVVKQTICSNVKFDTIVVNQSGTGFAKLQMISERLHIYPQPAKDELNLISEINIDFYLVKVSNSLGQFIKEEEIIFTENNAKIKTDNLSHGIYMLTLTDKDGFSISKKFVIAH